MQRWETPAAGRELHAPSVEGDGEVGGEEFSVTKPCSDEQHDDGNTSPFRGPDRNHIHF